MPETKDSKTNNTKNTAKTPTYEQLYELFKKEHIPVFANTQDLLMVFGCALRYALGRKTYVTSTIPDFIKDNVSLLDLKWFVNYLRDLCDYERNRDVWGADREYGYDHLCDYEGWLSFKKFLIDEYNKRGFKEPLASYQGIKPTELKLYFSKDRVREYIGPCQIINEAVNLMYNFLEKRGCVPPHHRRIEKYGIVFYDIGSATEWFELETIDFSEDKPRDNILNKLKEYGYPFASQYDKDGKRMFD